MNLFLNEKGKYTYIQISIQIQSSAFFISEIDKGKSKKKISQGKNDLHTTENEIHINLLTIGMIHKMLQKRKMEVAFWAVAILQPPVLTN